MEASETVFESLTDALSDAFDSAVAESHYTGEPCFWGVTYEEGFSWFTLVTSKQARWAAA